MLQTLISFRTVPGLSCLGVNLFGSEASGLWRLGLGVYGVWDLRLTIYSSGYDASTSKPKRVQALRVEDLRAAQSEAYSTLRVHVLLQYILGP